MNAKKSRLQSIKACFMLLFLVQLLRTGRSSPTMLPTSIPTSVTTPAPTGTPEFMQWLGDSGWWGSAGVWFPRGPPSSNDTIVLKGAGNSSLKLNYSTSVNEMTVQAPGLQLSSSLHVIHYLRLEGGTIDGGGIIQLTGSGYLNGTIRLLDITLLVTKSLVAMVSSTTYLGQSANISILGTLDVASGASIEPSVAEFGFLKSENAALNPYLDPDVLLPAENAIDDIVAVDSVHPFLRGDSLYDLELDSTYMFARSVYKRAGWPLYGQLVQPYDTAFTHVEECAEMCEQDESCLSFDYVSTTASCALSLLNDKSAGGLSYSEIGVDHYERRAVSSLQYAASSHTVQRPLLHIANGGLARFQDANISVLLELASYARCELEAGRKLVARAGILAHAFANFTLGRRSHFVALGTSSASFDFDSDATITLNRLSTLFVDQAASLILPSRVLNVRSETSLLASGSSKITATQLSGVSSLHIDDGSALWSSTNLTLDVTNSLTVSSDSTVFAVDRLIITVEGNASILGSVHSDGTVDAQRHTLGDATASMYPSGAGGGHAGNGGSGLGGSESDAGPAGAQGCLWWPTTPGGNGVATSSQDDVSGGVGGGAVQISVYGHLFLNGSVSADGTAGADAYAAGGGAGGSVILNATTLTGHGSITADGGSGGYPGGWIAGGGGGGGRILLLLPHANSTRFFHGLISAQGGSQASTPVGYDDTLGQPGAGTVAIYYSNVGPNEDIILLSLDAGRGSSGLSSSEATILDTCSASTIPHPGLAAAAADTIVHAVYVAGGARASVDSSFAVRGFDCGWSRRLCWPGHNMESCPADISGNGAGTIEVKGRLSLPTEASINAATLRFVNATSTSLAGGESLKVREGAVEFSGPGELIPAEGRATWTFKNRAYLSQIDLDHEVSLGLQTLDFADSTMSSAHNFTLNVTRLTSISSAATSFHSTATVLPQITLLDCQGTFNATSFSGLDFVLSSTTNATMIGLETSMSSEATLRVFGQAKFISTSDTSHRVLADTRGTNESTPQILNEKNGTIQFIGGGIVLIEPRLENRGLLQIVAETFYVGGGSQSVDGITSLHDGPLSIGGDIVDKNSDASSSAARCAFTFDPDSSLMGGGKLYARSGSILQVPALVENAQHNGVALYVVSGGELTVPASSLVVNRRYLGEVILMGGTFVSSYQASISLNIGNFSMSNGIAHIEEDAAVVIDTANISGGVLKLGHATNLTIGAFSWSAGDIYGPGTLYIANMLDLLGGDEIGDSADEVASCPRLLDEASLEVLSHGHWSNGKNIVVAQSSRLIVGIGASMNISSIAKVTAGGALYNYSQTPYAALDAWPPPLELYNVTVHECARTCVSGTGEIELARSHHISTRHVIYMSSLECRAFDYERTESRCVLHVRDDSPSAVEENAPWDHYSLHPIWSETYPRLLLRQDANLLITDNITLNLFLSTAPGSEVRIKSNSYLSLGNGGEVNGTFTIDESGTVEIGTAERGVQNSAAFSFRQDRSIGTGPSTFIQAEANAKLRITGGGPHFLPAILRAKALEVDIMNGGWLHVPDESDVLVRSVTATNSSVISVGTAATLHAFTKIAIESSQLKYESVGGLSAPAVFIGTSGQLTGEHIAISGLDAAFWGIGRSKSNTTLHLEVIHENAYVDVDGTLNISDRCGSINIGPHGTIAASRVFIECSNISIAENGFLHADGRGGAALGSAPDPDYAEGLSGGGGGGHGGMGAPGASGAFGGMAFGAADDPNLIYGGGSGAPARNGGGSGGGVIRIVAIENDIIVDGRLSASGSNGDARGGGGGAGGSIILRSLYGSLTGAGLILSQGGDGAHNPSNVVAGGGGGGGRILVSVEQQVAFSGTLRTIGGFGYDEASGWGGLDRTWSCSLTTCSPQFNASDLRTRAASGTLYLSVANTTHANSLGSTFSSTIESARRSRNGLSATALLIDANGTAPRSSLVTHIGSLETRTLDVLSIRGSAIGMLESGGLLSVGEFEGDDESPGILMIDNGTTLTNRTSQDIRIHGLTLEIMDSSMLGNSEKTHLMIANNGTLFLGAGSRCGGSTSGCIVETLDIDGVVRFGQALRNSTEDESYYRTAPELIVMKSLNLSFSGWIDADGAGHPGGTQGGLMYNESSGMAGGVGQSFGKYGPAGGGGGGHAGQGGDGLGTRPGEGGGTARLDSSLEEPSGLGGGGGGSNDGDGGAGGGRIRIQVYKDLQLNGLVSARGDDGTGFGGGGGAGGSILLTANETCTGVGTVSAAGGSGSRSPAAWGGNGAGGRVSLRCGYIDDVSSIRLLSPAGDRLPALSEALESVGQVMPSLDGAAESEFYDSTGAATGRLFGAAGTVILTILPNATKSAKRFVAVGSNNPATYLDYLITNLTSGIAHTAIRELGMSDNVIEELAISWPAILDLDGIESTLLIHRLQANADFSSSRAQLNIVNNTSIDLDVGTLPSGLSLNLVHGNLGGNAVSSQDSNKEAFVVQRNSSLNLGALGKTRDTIANGNYTFYGGLRVDVGGTVVVESSGLLESGKDSLIFLRVFKSLVIEGDGQITADGQGGIGAVDTSSFATGLMPGETLISQTKIRGGLPRGTGGGHAGAGGGALLTSGPLAGFGRVSHNFGYGSTIAPIHGGSGGGAGIIGGGGNGGGALRVEVAGDCILRGVLSARGLDASAETGGAGAGGSLWIRVTGTLSGNGTMDVSGGDAMSEVGGAGAGGRLLVHVGVDGGSFAGAEILAQAGKQYDEAFTLPAPGIIVLAVGEIDNSTLIADGRSGAIDTFYATISEDATFSTLQAKDLAQVAIIKNATVNVSHGLVGDGTISITDSSHLKLQKQSALTSGLKVGVSDNGKIILNSSALRLRGANTTLSILAGGSLLGCTDMSVSAGSRFEVSLAGSVGMSDTKPGTYLFNSLNISSGAAVFISSLNASIFNLIAEDENDDTYVDYRDQNDDGSYYSEQDAILDSVHILINGSLRIRSGGAIIGSGRGPRGGSGFSDGDGGASGGSWAGGGGGHGGKGGYSATGVSGGVARGSATAPLGGGGGGGSGINGGSGGAGGAGIRITVANDAHIDGDIISNGDDASIFDNGGGGAGGSVWILAEGTLSGMGQISVDGGSASLLGTNASESAGGAGAGGRIALDARVGFTFSGTLSAVGGTQVSWRPEASRQLSLARSGQENDRDDVSLGSLPDDRFNDGFMSAVLDTQRTVWANALLCQAAPGTILVRSSGSSEWDYLRVAGSENAAISTATSIFTTLESHSDAWELKTSEIFLSGSAAVRVSGPSTVSVSNISGMGTLSCSSDVSLQPLDTSLRIVHNASLELKSGAQINGAPKLLVAQGGGVELDFDAMDPTVLLTELELANSGTISGSYIHLNVSGDLFVASSSRLSASGRGGIGAAPGIDNGVGKSTGGSSALGGSGGAYGGTGLPGLGAWYMEVLADIAQNDVNTTPGLLSEGSAQYLIEHFWPGTPNATVAAQELLALAPHIWNTALANLRDHAAAAVEGTSGLATDSALFTQTYGGGRMVPESLRSFLTASSGDAYGDPYHPTDQGSGGGARHVLSGTGGAGGGAIRLRVQGQINVTGSISADGDNGQSGGGGGGSGGSVWLEACSGLVGNGIVSADGGRGGGATPADRDNREDGTYDWIEAAAYGGGGGGGGGRIAVSANCSVRNWFGSVSAKSGAPDGSSMAFDARYLGTIAWGNVSLAQNATIKTAATDGTLAIGDYVELAAHVSRRAPVQIIRSIGSGNGSITSRDEHSSIVRGSWRVRYRYSPWSTEISTVATASEVQDALLSLGTIGDISVDRKLNYTDGGWSWSITFFEAMSSITQPLLVVDTSRVYSTDGNATLAVHFSLDDGVSDVEAPLAYSGAKIPVIGLEQLGTGAHTAEWRSPSTLRLTITNATGSSLAPDVQAGALNFRFNLSMSNASGVWVPTSSNVPATWNQM